MLLFHRLKHKDDATPEVDSGIERVG